MVHQRIALQPPVIGSQRGNAQPHRQENAESSRERTRKTGYDITDECHGCDDWTGSDHGYRDSIQELALGEPVLRLDGFTIEKWNDGQATAEHEQRGLGEEPEYGDQ